MTPKKWKTFIESFPKLSLMFLALIGREGGSDQVCFVGVKLVISSILKIIPYKIV